MGLIDYMLELEQLFEIDKEMVAFEFGNLETLREKLSWYISHDQQLKNIDIGVLKASEYACGMFWFTK